MTETGIPIPPAKGRVEAKRGTVIREKMDQLLINGSFFIPCKDWHEEQQARNTVTRVQHRTYRGARKFVGRKMFDHEAGSIGIRIWRVS